MIQDYCKSAVPADGERGQEECGRVLRTDGGCDNAPHTKREAGRAKGRKNV